jgi:coenzyme Q-binding protein COQ10
MPSHREHKILPYSPAQMFALVMDIERYPEFLPWCAGARINERNADYLMADVLVGYKMLREKFTSRVNFVPGAEIHVEYLDGPLKHLTNDWIFLPEKPGQCLVDFRLDFEFRNRLLQRLIEGFFDKALKKMMDAFEARAMELYSH